MDINEYVKECHKTAREKGWWEDKDSRSDGELIALMHSELSEALQELREPNYNLGVVSLEFADVIIRIFDYCGARKIDLEEALRVKMEYNKTRPYRHGGKRF